MTQSPPPELYDTNYYNTSCEGHNYTIDNPSPRLAKFDSWVAPHLGNAVLDLGYGRGELSIKAARLPTVGGVVSIDYSIDATKLFMDNLLREPIPVRRKIIQIYGDIDRILPHINIQFTSVIAFDVIEHIYPEQVRRLFDVLSGKVIPTGSVFVVTPLSTNTPNERHVWLAKQPADLFGLVNANYFSCAYVGYAGSGEDHMFQFTRK